MTTDVDGGRLFSDPATSSKIPALEREGFRELAGYARPGDQLTVSELYRSCRDLADILAVPEGCRARGVKLRVLSGALSGIVDLATTDATTTMLVNVLVSVGRFQRDLQNELTRDGPAAAWAQEANAEWRRFEGCLNGGAGTCNVTGTATTMAAVAEVLGFTLPGTALLPASSAARRTLAGSRLGPGFADAGAAGRRPAPRV